MTTSELRLQLMKRARFRCECGGEKFTGCQKPAAELDHFFGRGAGRVPESAESCWMLSTDCHLAKTVNHPGAAEWLKRFMWHCTRHANSNRAQNIEECQRWDRLYKLAENRLAFVEQRDDFRKKLKGS